MQLIINKQYQLEDNVSSVVTTKVKGQGFVPINSTYFYDKNDSMYFENKYGLDKNKKYKVYDTAGIC